MRVVNSALHKISSEFHWHFNNGPKIESCNIHLLWHLLFFMYVNNQGASRTCHKQYRLCSVSLRDPSPAVEVQTQYAASCLKSGHAVSAAQRQLERWRSHETGARRELGHCYSRRSYILLAPLKVPWYHCGYEQWPKRLGSWSCIRQERGICDWLEELALGRE